MRKTILNTIFYLLVIQGNIFAQNPLQSFDSVIGGEWWLGEDSYQTFEWGIGNLSVRAEAFFIVDGEAVKVSEGEWFYHPGEQKIKGFFNTQNMPITFFDYETSFDESGNMINHLLGYGSMGDGVKLYETWKFTSENSFTWTLSIVDDDHSLTEMMNGDYTRKSE